MRRDSGDKASTPTSAMERFARTPAATDTRLSRIGAALWATAFDRMAHAGTPFHGAPRSRRNWKASSSQVTIAGA
jgi:hypothetical protein